MRFTVAAAAATALASAYGEAVTAAESGPRCALAEQVRLCVSHTSMQRALCPAEDLDCQCLWAGHSTMCFAPCVAEKVFADGMHVARGDQLTVCSQAAKFGPLAKERERLRQEERSGRRPNRPSEPVPQQPAASPRNINELNAAHEVPASDLAPATTAAAAAAATAPAARPVASPPAGVPAAARPAVAGKTAVAPTAPHSRHARPAGPASDADRAFKSVDSAAPALAAHSSVVLGAVALAGLAALF
ncbi:hypothetical protein H4R21_002697 [Coemansia helicoidea]|uniref:Uncharacterized protein n=1 Tax=Coemansia helicoidea TaxID=1286919 RepID=A0ACC1L6D5_9FUNG|nr:hypothetical protein H4R21_002697 [Coemansia helicoidea]